MTRLPKEVEIELRVLHDNAAAIQHPRNADCANYDCGQMYYLRLAAAIGRASLNAQRKGTR